MTKKIIIKFGTESLMSNQKLSQIVFDKIADQIAKLIHDSYQVYVVTSGSVQAGRETVQSMVIDGSKLHKKDLAGIGSVKLLSMWQKAFAKQGLGIAQVWVTHANIQHFFERKSVEQSLLNLQKAGVVPIINTNDVVSSREIELMDRGISENDQLVRLVASIINPDIILFITSVGGVYSSDPRVDHHARLYDSLSTDNIETIAGLAGKSNGGSGGMGQKIIEAGKCCRKSRQVAILGWQNNSITRYVAGEQIGTTLVQGVEFMPEIW